MATPEVTFWDRLFAGVELFIPGWELGRGLIHAIEKGDIGEVGQTYRETASEAFQGHVLPGATKTDLGETEEVATEVLDVAKDAYEGAKFVVENARYVALFVGAGGALIGAQVLSSVL